MLKPPPDIKSYVNGGMNQDDAAELLNGSEYREAFNISVTGETSEEAGYVTNIQSTVLIPLSSPDGIEKGIGSNGFEIIRSGIAVRYNSQDFWQLIEIDYDTDTAAALFTNKTNSGGNSLFILNPQFYFTDIKLANDKFLVMTNGDNQPMYINLDRLRAGGYGTLTEEDFLLIKQQPLIPPESVYNNDLGRSVNLLAQRLFQFRYTFEGLDFELSAPSTISKRAVPVAESTPAVGTDVTKNNNIIVSLNIGGERQQAIHLWARYSNLDWFVIRSITRAQILALPPVLDVLLEVYEAYDPTTNIYSFAFYNDGLYDNVDVLASDQDYDHVPLKAESAEIINGNKIALGGLTEGYDRPTIAKALTVTYYQPDVTVAYIDPANNLSSTNFQYRISGSHKRHVEVTFLGTAKTGDKITITLSDIRDYSNTLVYEYTVTGGQDGNTQAVVTSLSTIVPASASNVDVLIFTTPSYFELTSVAIDLQNAGASQFKSVHALKTNSSYQAGIRYFDKFGRYFPLVTGNDYIFKTNSYAQTHGLSPQLNWTISTLEAPAEAVSYQWMLSENNTHLNTLYVDVKYDPVLSADAPNYLIFNMNALKQFNEVNSSSVLNYDYVAGDRCTFMYYDNSGTKVWFDSPAIDVNVVDFTIVVDSVDPSIINWILKVEKSAAITPAVITAITDKSILIELYTPKPRATTTNGVTTYNETLLFEIGEQFPIVNSQHSVLSGVITDGDVYYKSRGYVNAVDLTTLQQFLVEDFNFSDFYQSNYTSYGRPGYYSDEPGNVELKASIRYSDVFRRDSLVNGLTRFFGENIYGDGDGETSSNYGWIRKLWQRNNELVVIQELKVGYIPVFQTIVEDQASQEQYALSLHIFNKIRYNQTGNIGIGNAKESFVFYNNNCYFVDPFRSEPIRAGLDGVYPISGKMSKYFKRVFQEAYKAGKKLIGNYNIFNNEYIVTIENDGDIVNQIPFNTDNWQFDDTYVIPAAGISITAQGTKGVATYNTGTGIATYTPNDGETGSDNFTFSFTPAGGVLTTKGVCITILPGNDQVFPFSFLAQTGIELSTLTYSNTILVFGNDIPATISISGNAGEYRINSGSWVTTPGEVSENDIVGVRQISSASYETLVTTTLSIDGQTADFDVTTKDQSPDPFTFVDVIDAEISTLYTSNTVTITGITGAIAISIVGGEYQIGAGSWTSAPGTVTNGQTVKVRRTSSPDYATSVDATLTVGSYSDTYSILTRAAENVEVNFAMTFGSDPTTNHWNVIERIRGGITTTVATISADTSGTLSAGDFKEGDTITVYQGAYDPFMWAPDSKVNLHIDVDAVELYDGDSTSQGATQSNPPYVIASGVSVIDILSTGSSEAVGYESKNLHSMSYLGSNEFSIDLTDNDEAGLGLTDLEPQNGSGDYSFNVVTGAGDLTVTITNNKATDIDYSLTAEGGYIKFGTIAAMGNVVHSDVTKGDVTIEVSDSSGGIACGIPVPYSGGQTYPTIQVITLGTGTGTVTLNFNAFTVPDKFIVEFDGVEVINTGYRGDSGQQAALDAALATYGAPPETIMGTGSGTANFSKGTATTTATVYVYAPIAGTAWEFTLDCPV